MFLNHFTDFTASQLRILILSCLGDGYTLHHGHIVVATATARGARDVGNAKGHQFALAEQLTQVLSVLLVLIGTIVATGRTHGQCQAAMRRSCCWCRCQSHSIHFTWLSDEEWFVLEGCCQIVC